MKVTENHSSGEKRSSSFTTSLVFLRSIFAKFSNNVAGFSAIRKNLPVYSRQLRATALLVLLPLVFALSASALPKDAGGIVVDSNGIPIKGVKVVVSRTMIFTSTDERGRFSLKGIPDGSSIIFSCEGYKSHVMLPLMASNHSLYIKLVRDPGYRKAPAGDSTKPQAPLTPGSPGSDNTNADAVPGNGPSAH